MKLLEMAHIYKAFNGVPILKDVRLTVGAGEVHALLGENGAGKSTLMNILAGVYLCDAGTITYNGNSVENMSVNKAKELGIAFVHQELNFFNDLTVYENIFLGREYVNRFGKCDKKKMIEETKTLMARLGVKIEPEQMVSKLTISEKQLLEIGKALFFQAKLLILDEPTTSLSSEEAGCLFAIIEHLKKEGTSFIYISHKMPEIFQIADRYTVLRNGEFISEGKIVDTNSESITKMMVGYSLKAKNVYRPRKTGSVVLELKNYSGPGFDNINLKVKKGQIIGLTGLQGAGSSELLQCMFGITRKKDGLFFVNGKIVKTHSIHNAMKLGIAMLPSNRRENSVIPDGSILENMYISEHTLSAIKFFIHKKQEIARYNKYKQTLSIKAESCKNNITSLSGGNQQKLFIARWLNTKAEILLLDNPTQGIDIGAKAEIYTLIVKLAEEGKTILINSQGISEIQKIADECAVFYEGKLVKILEHSEITEEMVMLHSTNAGGVQ